MLTFRSSTFPNGEVELLNLWFKLLRSSLLYSSDAQAAEKIAGSAALARNPYVPALLHTDGLLLMSLQFYYSSSGRMGPGVRDADPVGKDEKLYREDARALWRARFAHPRSYGGQRTTYTDRA